MGSDNVEYQELVRGCEGILPIDGLKAKLSKNKTLKIKAGFDPTAQDLHLGHTVLLNKLRQFQQLGHEVIFLIGDFTATIGDPSGKNKTRVMLDAQTAAQNARTYARQVFKVLDEAKTTVVYNSQWLDGLTARDLIQLAQHHTVSQMLERDDFHRRYRDEQPIALHEFIYPLLQGYDSVMLHADVECGGADQRFNLLMGRELQKQLGQEAQVVVMTPLLEGLDGVKKMSKSLDNYVGIDEPPSVMFGKIMSISDELMWRYYDLISFKSIDAIDELKQQVHDGLNPRDVKVALAQEIVARFHDTAAAEDAYAAFVTRFQKKQIPDDLPIRELVVAESTRLTSILKLVGLTASTSEAMRLIKSAAVKVDGTKINQIDFVLDESGSYVIEVGKHRVIKLEFLKKG